MLPALMAIHYNCSRENLGISRTKPMPFPEAERVELPILQELEATGGSDHLRYLYERLVRYFPQLTNNDLNQTTPAGRSRWRSVVQRAGRQLIDKGELRREGAVWALTGEREVSHKEAQLMLIEIGRMLGRHAEAEFEYYDVVWRDSPSSPRLSHVFEVQIAGSVDSALTRLKQAYDAQRTRPFLVIADERAASFADRRLIGPFHEIWEAVSLIGVGELKRLYESLKAQEELLEKLMARD